MSHLSGAAMFLVVTIAFGIAAPASAQSSRPAFRPGKVSFAVKFKEERSNYDVLAVSVLPGEKLRIEIVDAGARTYRVYDKRGDADRSEPRRWVWSAPDQAGLYPVRVTCQTSGETMTLNVFVLVPIEKARGGSLNGYAIGDYWWATVRDRPIYRPPPGLIEVTPDNVDTKVSPHFTLRQFLCKQAGDYPKYVVVRERLLLKLELILETANAAGYRCDTFGVLSGYRTPSYNKAIGNVKYSRHVWGGAADIYIDENPHDGMMDDLNQDGRIDVGDAAVLYEMIDRLYGSPNYTPFVGGLGRYKKTDRHGPFVHVDNRGRRTRWGH